MFPAVFSGEMVFTGFAEKLTGKRRQQAVCCSNKDGPSFVGGNRWTGGFHLHASFDDVVKLAQSDDSLFSVDVKKWWRVSSDLRDLCFAQHFFQTLANFNCTLPRNR